MESELPPPTAGDILENNPHLVDDFLADREREGTADAETLLAELHQRRLADSGATVTVIVPPRTVPVLEHLGAEYDQHRDSYRRATRHVDAYDQRMTRKLRYHFASTARYAPFSIWPTCRDESIYDASKRLIGVLENMRVPEMTTDELWNHEDDITWDMYWSDIQDAEAGAEPNLAIPSIVKPPVKPKMRRSDRIKRLKRIL